MGLGALCLFIDCRRALLRRKLVFANVWSIAWVLPRFLAGFYRVGCGIWRVESAVCGHHRSYGCLQSYESADCVLSMLSIVCARKASSHELHVLEMASLVAWMSTDTTFLGYACQGISHAVSLSLGLHCSCCLYLLIYLDSLMRPCYQTKEVEPTASIFASKQSSFWPRSV